MTSFASLMALSASHTRESQQAVEHALQERKRKEALQRKQQEEKEAKEREQEKKMRLKRFEEEKRQRERDERREAERKAKELAAQRREDEQRDALRYGPKKAAKMVNGSNAGSSSTARSDATKKRKQFDDDDDDDDGPPGVVLTREEIRQKKQQAEMRKLFSSSKRSTQSVPSYRKTGQRLPGGAVNIIIDPTKGQDASSQGSISVRERILHMPNSLTKLNTNKKDNRTMDEILTDIQVKKKGKVLEGESATAFDDWFGNSRKKTESQQRKSPVSASISLPSKETTEQRMCLGPSCFSITHFSFFFFSQDRRNTTPQCHRPRSLPPLCTRLLAAPQGRHRQSRSPRQHINHYTRRLERAPQISILHLRKTNYPRCLNLMHPLPLNPHGVITQRYLLTAQTRVGNANEHVLQVCPTHRHLPLRRNVRSKTTFPQRFGLCLVKIVVSTRPEMF